MASGLNFVLALGPLKFPGPRGGVFWWIAYLGGGVFVECMPTGGEDKPGELFLFPLPLLNFPGPGSGVFWNISTIGSDASGIFMTANREGKRTKLLSRGLMPAGREGKRAAPFVSVVPPLNFHRARARGGAEFGGSPPIADKCQRGGRGNLLNRFLLRFRR